MKQLKPQILSHNGDQYVVLNDTVAIRLKDRIITGNTAYYSESAVVYNYKSNFELETINHSGTPNYYNMSTTAQSYINSKMYKTAIDYYKAYQRKINPEDFI